MKRYLASARIHIIDPAHTVKGLMSPTAVATVARGEQVLFVGTKK